MGLGGVTSGHETTHFSDVLIKYQIRLPYRCPEKETPVWHCGLSDRVFFEGNNNYPRF